MIQAEVSPQSNVLSEPERRKLLDEWNATALDLPKVARIQQLIEQRAKDNPEEIALVCRNQRLTYSELNVRAEQLSSHLRSLGVKEESLVGICLERSLEMAIGLLGILKSGGAYVPLDPTYPQERLVFMLEDSKPLVVVTQMKLLEQLPKTAARILCVDAHSNADRNVYHASRITDHQSRTTHHDSSHESSLAYVIYTSGSTGKPKGVMIEHANVLNFFAAMNARIPNKTGDAWLAVTSPSFDISVLELLWTLSRGMKVVVYPGDDAQGIDNPDEYSIGALIERHSITHLQCTPSMARMLLLDEKSRQAIGGPEVLLIGGESFPAKLARELRESFKGTLLNMYGPTETTVWSTTWQLPPDSAPARISIGRPIANTQLYIVDSNLQLVPIGSEGELLIGGAGVARGYLHREQLTCERFIANPFAHSSSPAPRLYRTGDLARYLPDGNIELLGRIDHQIKIRGHRVELGEIEALLNEHPDVRESVVLLREIASGETALVGYIIPRQEQKPSREQLRDYLFCKLPEHMVPSRFVFLTEFPQTPNKKIDRNAFPPPAIEASEPKQDSKRPATAVEEALAALWQDLLGVQRVAPEDNFFELGGHSMLAMQLVAKVRKRFNIDFPLKNIFERQTLAGMAQIIEAMSWSNFVNVPRIGEREVVDV